MIFTSFGRQAWWHRSSIRLPIECYYSTYFIL